MSQTSLENRTQESGFFDSLIALGNKLKQVPFFAWFVSKGYTQGVFWALMICVSSVSNDVLMRFLGSRLHSFEIVFFRFLFGMVSVLPFIYYRGFAHLKTKRPVLHAIRAIIGVIAIAACCFSVNMMPLNENTTIMFTEPLFFLPLAVLMLREKVDAPRWIATLVGFAGLMIIVQPGTDAFKLAALVPITAAMCFALLNVMTKIMVRTENTLSMLFYFSFGTFMVALFPLPFIWQTPTWGEIGLLFLLGIGANAIQVCLFMAFSATDASALMPFRYVEFIFSALVGFLLFSEIPTVYTLIGVLLIIASAMYISYSENRKEQQSAKLPESDTGEKAA